MNLENNDQLAIRLSLSGSASNATADSSASALLGLHLPDGATLDTQVLGSDTPAFLGREFPPVAVIPAPPALGLALTGLAILAFWGRRTGTAAARRRVARAA